MGPSGVIREAVDLGYQGDHSRVGCSLEGGTLRGGAAEEGSSD